MEQFSIEPLQATEIKNAAEVTGRAMALIPFIKVLRGVNNPIFMVRPMSENMAYKYVTKGRNKQWHIVIAS